MPSRLRFAALALAVFLSGCYSHRVSTVGTDPQGTLPPATDYEGTVAWSLLWGVVERVPVPSNCQGQALAEVKASSNFAFDVLKVATLGAVAPVRMDWLCARPTIIPGQFPNPDTDN
jgi:hypothetical protein